MSVTLSDMRCKYFGKVRNNEGKIVDSRLYQGLLSITSPAMAKKIYGKTITDKFVNEVLPRIPHDSLGEPTLLSILAASEELRNSVNLDAVTKALARDMNLGRPMSKEEVDRIAEDFKKVNPFKGTIYLNPVEHKSNESPVYWTATISGRDQMSPRYAKFIDSLKGILSDAGFSIGALNDYEKALGVRGVLDTDAVASGMKEVIRLAQSPEGIRALPEEFAHLVINGLSSEPRVERLLQYIKTPGVIEKILGDDYQQYKELYGSEEKLAKEAAAKLLTQSLEEIGVTGEQKSILQRLVGLVKHALRRVLSSITPASIDQALANAKGVSLSIAEDTLEGRNTGKLSERVTTREGVYYEIDEKTKKAQELLKRLMRATQIKLRVMENRGSTIGQEIQSKTLSNLQMAFNKGQVLMGITQYMSDVSKHSAKMVELVDQMNEGDPIEKKAGLLSNVLSYTSSYITALQDAKNTLLELKEEFADQRGNDILAIIDPLLRELQYSNVKIREKMKTTFSQFLEGVYGSNMVVIKTGARAGTYSISDLLDYLPSDIGTAEMWMNGMAESTDLVTKIVDMAIRNKIGKAYSDTLDVEKELMAAWKKLKEAGYTNTEFLYEMDSRGIPTGRLITPYDSAAYKDAYMKAVGDLQNRVDFREALEKWKKENPLESFKSKAYENLSAAQKEFYNTYMALKRKAEELLPKSKRDLYRAVSLRKDFIERIAGSGSKEELIKQIKDGILDQFMRRVDDGESAFSKGYLNIQGELIRSIPILYTATLEDPRSLSLDGVSALLAYTAMANRYSQLKGLEDIINIGDDIMKRRKVGIIRGGKKVQAIFDKIGNINLDTPLLKEGENSNAYKMWRHLINTQIYGETSNESDQIQTSGISLMKSASLLNKISTIADMGFNLMLGVANVGTGIVFQNTEAIAGQYFTKSQLGSSDLDFFKELPAIVAELPKRIKTSKVGLFNELMDIDQESLGAFRDRGIAKGTLSRLFSMKTMLFMLGAGDYWIKSRSAMALAKNTKLYQGGKELNLWEALDKVPVNSSDTSQGYRLVLKEGLKDAEGKDFTQQDLIKFRHKITRLNHKIVGMMNTQDLNMAKKTVIGKLAFLYRSWMVPSYNRRFQKSTYDVLMGEESEGYYRTLFRILKNIGNELRAGSVATIAGNLTDTEKYNLRRAITEISQLALTIVAYNILSGAWEDDDKNWLQNFILYELRRMQTEVGAVTPSPRMISEVNNIVKSPVAATRALERLSNLFMGLTNPNNYIEEVQSGKFKGRSRAFKMFIESPLALNANTIMRQLYPEEAIRFYDQN